MKTLSYWPFQSPPRENQVKALEWLEKQDAKYLILESPVGCHRIGTRILMFNGTTKPVEEIRVGDLLMGPDSTPRQVLRLHTGNQSMFQIQPQKSESFVVNEDHILSLKTTNVRNRHNQYGFTGTEVINISVKDFISKSKTFQSSVKLYRPEQINFNQHNELPIDPYLLGLLIGDGTICNSNIGITTADQPIETYIHEQAVNYQLKINVQGEGKAKTFYFSTGERGGDVSIRKKNYLLEALKDLELQGKRSGDKFIPLIYKTASRQQRLELLAGLIDTDGYYSQTFEVTTKSQQLANDIQFVCWSLGFSANLMLRHVQTASCFKKQVYYSIHISGKLDQIPTKLQRKQATARKQVKRVNVEGFTVHSLNEEQYFGFEVDQDNLYVMGNFFVSHNSGKSNIGIAYQQYLNSITEDYNEDGLRVPTRSYILTPQRILQAQYEESFKGNTKVNLASFYGKSNYTCQQKNTTCDIGGILKPPCTGCPFVAAKRRAATATNTVLNYKLALLQFAYGQKTFPPRSLMIMDECHTLETHLIDFDALKIADWRCKKYNIQFNVQKTIPSALEWMKEVYLKKMKEVIQKLEPEIEDLEFKAEDGHKLTRAEIKKLQEFDGLVDHVDEVIAMSLKEPDKVEENFVLVHEPLAFQFKRLYGAYTFARLIKPNANKFLFMSSTVLNQKGFCKDLGIDPEESAFLSLNSDFPPENRPVFYIPSMKMNVGWNDPQNSKERRNMLDGIVKILESHKDETGIIHTGNFKIAEWLVREFRDRGISHNIHQHNPESGNDRNDVIEAFTNDPKPSVLISPSSTEGLDLKEDLGRFAIFVKVPFGNLGDQWIKRRMELSTEWYQRQALINIIQGGGRVVRSKDDWGHVYILDQSFAYLYKMTHGQIPQWWKDAYKIV